MYNNSSITNPFKDGKLFLIDKTKGDSSFYVVKKIRQAIQKKTGEKIKVGHAGTLDPLAEGLLIICVGKKTKEIYKYQNLNKTYVGEMIIGVKTKSFDLETEFYDLKKYNHISESQIKDATDFFKGEIKQSPPIYSAIKVKGKKLYEYARKNEKIKIPIRQVNVMEFNINEINLPKIKFEIKCEKGTYIRSIVNDFGLKLECGAVLSELKRTQIGNYSIKNSKKINEVINFIVNYSE